MTISFVLLFMDERPPVVQFVCPLCGGQTCLPAPPGLGELPCSHCGVSLDASEATVHLLNEPSRLREKPSRERLLW